MPSFAISQFIILLEPLWVSAVFLLLSTGPNLDGTKILTVSVPTYYIHISIIGICDDKLKGVAARNAPTP